MTTKAKHRTEPDKYIAKHTGILQDKHPVLQVFWDKTLTMKCQAYDKTISNCDNLNHFKRACLR